MKKTQRFIIIQVKTSLISQVEEVLAGFKACTIVKKVSPELLNTVFYHNKNAVYVTSYVNWDYIQYNPIVLQCRFGISNIEMNILGSKNLVEDFPKILDAYDVDVGDHSCFDSSHCSSNTDNCLLCRIRDRKSQNIEHIVYESNNFYVVPGTGAFFEGYLMIVPKDHITSFALLSEEKRDEFLQVLNDIRLILQGIYKKKVFAFECSSGKTGAGKHKTSIVHAHFHLAPTEMPVLREVQKSGLHPSLISKHEWGKYGENPYMLYIDQDDNWFIADDPNDYYPRQHPRQVLAEWMGCYNIYNWRYYPFRERMDIIVEEFRNFCKVNFQKLPKWVQESICFED